MEVDTDALRWFQQVADGTTVTEVSELEAVTQSGVSRALARLERQLGTPLLRRSGRILRLTHAGAVFKRHVDAVLHHLDDGIAAVNQLIEPDTGSVALAFQHSLGTWLVPDLVRSFRAGHPHLPAPPPRRRARHAPASPPGGAPPADRYRAATPGAAARPLARRPAAHPPGRPIRGAFREPAAGLRAAATDRRPLR